MTLAHWSVGFMFQNGRGITTFLFTYRVTATGTVGTRFSNIVPCTQGTLRYHHLSKGSLVGACLQSNFYVFYLDEKFQLPNFFMASLNFRFMQEGPGGACVLRTHMCVLEGK